MAIIIGHIGSDAGYTVIGADGAAANFAWRPHRRTRSEHRADAPTSKLLRYRGSRWASDFKSAVNEVHALYRIREWGHD